jgi:hypothetical protein
MHSVQNQTLSAFGQAALALDHDFTELERLAAQIERLEFESDAGFEKAQELLTRFSECGQRIGEGVQTLAQSLEKSRLGAEKAAEMVSARANLIHERHLERERMFARFRVLGESVRELSGEVAQLKRPSDLEPTNEEKALWPVKLQELEKRFAPLIEEARKLQDEAHVAKLRTIEKNADSLGQSLAAARKKLGALAESLIA